MNLNMILLKELKVGWYIELIKRKFVELLDFIKYSIKYNQLHAKRKINLNILLITGGIILMNACVSDDAGEHFKLKKEVTLSDGRPHGLTENVLKEIDLNLNAHELIKIQVAGDDRDARKAMYAEICAKSSAIAVHRIGKQLVVYRKSDTIKESAKVVIPKP